MDEVKERFEKFSIIVDKLKEYGIEYIGNSGGCPVVEDKSCGFKLIHNLMTWQVFPIDEVVKMIVTGRDNHINRKK